MKIIFFGTPDIALKSIQTLYYEDVEILAVVTQPDKAVGRKQILSPPPVKELAEKLRIKVLQPKNSKELYDQIKDYKADFFIVFAYGMIMPKKILQLPKYGAINIHTSLLPKYRGASPIQQAILNGDNESGISIMKMDEEMDHGDIYIVKRIPIEEKDTGESLSIKLSELSGRILTQTLVDIKENFLTPIPQPHNKASYCKKISKEDAKISFKKTAKEINNMIKAYTPWPGTYFEHKEKKIKILEADIDENKKMLEETFKIEDNKLLIGTFKGVLIPKTVQLEGKTPTNIKNFLNGYAKLFE